MVTFSRHLQVKNLDDQVPTVPRSSPSHSCNSLLPTACSPREASLSPPPPAASAAAGPGAEGDARPPGEAARNFTQPTALPRPRAPPGGRPRSAPGSSERGTATGSHLRREGRVGAARPRALPGQGRAPGGQRPGWPPPAREAQGRRPAATGSRGLGPTPSRPPAGPGRAHRPGAVASATGGEAPPPPPGTGAEGPAPRGGGGSPRARAGGGKPRSPPSAPHHLRRARHEAPAGRDRSARTRPAPTPAPSSPLPRPWPRRDWLLAGGALRPRLTDWSSPSAPACRERAGLGAAQRGGTPGLAPRPSGCPPPPRLRAAEGEPGAAGEGRGRSATRPRFPRPGNTFLPAAVKPGRGRRPSPRRRGREGDDGDTQRLAPCLSPTSLQRLIWWGLLAPRLPVFPPPGRTGLPRGSGSLRGRKAVRPQCFFFRAAPPPLPWLPGSSRGAGTRVEAERGPGGGMASCSQPCPKAVEVGGRWTGLARRCGSRLASGTAQVPRAEPAAA